MSQGEVSTKVEYLTFTPCKIEQRFSEGDRVRIGIPNSSDVDHDRFHEEGSGLVIHCQYRAEVLRCIESSIVLDL